MISLAVDPPFSLSLQFARDFNHSLVPRGEGNVVSIEFNLLYRWHACISQQDTVWTEQTFKKLFPGKKWDQVSQIDISRNLLTLF